MDNERIILHSDMNSFYASVEMMLNPELKGKPVAVCGSTEERHGIVLAKSDLAKKAGVKTGMVNWEARQLCPGLIVVPPQYDQYLKYSKLARQIYHRYTDLVEPYGMDECWLDVTGSGVCGTGMALRDVLKEAVNDQYDYIDWWLYEATDDYTVWEADCTMKYCLKDPEALYDYITGTLKPVPVSSGESTSQQE